VASIPCRLHSLASGSSDDPVLLEEYKMYTQVVDTRIQDVGPQIKDIKVVAYEMKRLITKQLTRTFSAIIILLSYFKL